MSWGDLPPPPPPPSADWLVKVQSLNLEWQEEANGLGYLVDPTGLHHHLYYSSRDGTSSDIVISGDHPTRFKLLLSEETAAVALGGEQSMGPWIDYENSTIWQMRVVVADGANVLEAFEA